ncbi:MAG: TetR/AcrR family transcriptional regulator [Spirochaetales bacterium]|nr:TetR/AcrR family transcriptional regulator [Spirochaetales bacterium]
MSSEDASVQGKIIDATVECIEREGIQAVTIRKIAKLAGVNSAAINYYFRSKEKLVDEVKRRTVEHVFEDWREILNDESRSVRERLFLLFTDYMEGAIMFPGITKAHMWEPLIDDSYDSLFVKLLNGFFQELAKKLGLELKRPPEELKLVVIHLFSALTMPVLMPDLYREFFGGRTFREAKVRRALIEHVLQLYFDEGQQAEQVQESEGQ